MMMSLSYQSRLNLRPTAPFSYAAAATASPTPAKGEDTFNVGCGSLVPLLQMGGVCKAALAFNRPSVRPSSFSA